MLKLSLHIHYSATDLASRVIALDNVILSYYELSIQSLLKNNSYYKYDLRVSKSNSFLSKINLLHNIEQGVYSLINIRSDTFIDLLRKLIL